MNNVDEHEKSLAHYRQCKFVYLALVNSWLVLRKFILSKVQIPQCDEIVELPNYNSRQRTILPNLEHTWYKVQFWTLSLSLALILWSVKNPGRDGPSKVKGQMALLKKTLLFLLLLSGWDENVNIAENWESTENWGK